MHNVSNCHISFSELYTLSELHGSIQTELGAPTVHLHSRIPTVTDQETKQLETIVPADIKTPDDINSQVTAQRKPTALALFQLHRTTMQQEKQTHWYITLTTYNCITISLGILCFHVYTHSQEMKCYFFRTNSDQHTNTQTTNSKIGFLTFTLPILMLCIQYLE